jgi:hypothetical protein
MSLQKSKNIQDLQKGTISAFFREQIGINECKIVFVTNHVGLMANILSTRTDVFLMSMPSFPERRQPPQLWIENL